MPTGNVAGDLRAQTPPKYLDSHVGPPPGPRWGGTRPERISPAQALAIREKRAWSKATADGVFERAANADALASALRDARPLALAAYVPAFAELHVRALRLLAALLLLHKRGHESVLLTHAELAERLGVSLSSARRSMATLCTRGLVQLVAPAFVQHGAASSRRGNVYAVAPEVLASLAKLRSVLQTEQASGTALGQEYKPSGSSHPKGDSKAPLREIANVVCVTQGCGQPEPEGRQAKAESPDAVRPETRQGETRSVSGMAGNEVVAAKPTLDELLCELDATRVQLDDPFIGELYALLARQKGRGAPTS